MQRRLQMARAHAILRGMSSSPPPCPKHPTAMRINARVPGRMIREWVCLVCGAVTGPAPEKEQTHEFETIGPEEVAPIRNTDDVDTLVD